MPGQNQLREGCVNQAAAPCQEDRRRDSRGGRPERGRRVERLRLGSQKRAIGRCAEEVRKLRGSPDRTKSRKEATKSTKTLHVVNLKVKLEYLQGKLFPIIAF